MGLKVAPSARRGRGQLQGLGGIFWFFSHTIYSQSRAIFFKREEFNYRPRTTDARRVDVAQDPPVPHLLAPFFTFFLLKPFRAFSATVTINSSLFVDIGIVTVHVMNG